MHNGAQIIRTDHMRAIRKKHNLTQTEVAAHLNVTRQCYSQYETGQRIPDIQCLIKLSSFYKTSIDDFINFPSSNQFLNQKIPKQIPQQTFSNKDLCLFYLSPQEATLIDLLRHSDKTFIKTIINDISSKIKSDSN